LGEIVRPRVPKKPEISIAEREEISKKYQSVRRWLHDKGEESRYTYARYMILFTRITGKDPDQFLAWAKTVDPLDVQDLINQTAETLPTKSIQFNFKIEMRSFLHANGYNNLPKARLSYTLKEWHRAYRREEIRKLLSYLDSPIHKLYVYMAVESGLRARTVLALKWRHIQEDFDKGLVPVAIRLEPEFYQDDNGLKRKSAGFTFLGKRSVALLKEAVGNGLLKPNPNSFIIDRSYSNIFKVVDRARKKARLDPSLSLNHSLRKYFEDALDHSKIDIDKKRLIEGHFGDTRAKSYTGREWSDLSDFYSKAYPQIDVDAGDPELETKLVDWQFEKAALEKKIERLENDKTLEDRIASLEHKNKELMIYMLAGTQGFVPLAPEKLHQIPTQDLDKALGEYVTRLARKGAQKNKKEGGPFYKLGLQIGKHAAEPAQRG